MLKGNLRCVRMIVLLDMEQISVLPIVVMASGIIILFLYTLRVKDKYERIKCIFALFVLVVNLVCYIILDYKSNMIIQSLKQNL